MKNNDLCLGFHTHIPAICKNEKIYMPGHIGFFVEGLASNCKKIICFQHIPRNDEIEQMDYEITSPNVILINMGKHRKIPTRTLYAFLTSRKIKKYDTVTDAMLIRTPTPLLPIFNFWLKKKIVLFVVGDYLAGADSLNAPYLKKQLIKMWSKWIDNIQWNISKKNLTFVNGHPLYNKFENNAQYLVETRTTTLRENDFFYKEDTCLSSPYKLFYSGRIIKEKGILDLFNAFLKIRGLGFDVEMHLVGAVEKNDNTLELLMELARTNNVESKVIYSGYKAAGKELLSFYRKADIFVCPTRIVSETYPRTIREAMASSVPVIATKVGSLPDYISGSSLLIEPGDVQGLTDAIRKVIVDKQLRRELIKKGLETVKEDTIENRSIELITEIKKWLSRGTKVDLTN
jgi:glycosyltransferase involved in cell wall biosynthesis